MVRAAFSADTLPGTDGATPIRLRYVPGVEERKLGPVFNVRS
jgi:hypothetical protein